MNSVKIILSHMGLHWKLNLFGRIIVARHNLYACVGIYNHQEVIVNTYFSTYLHDTVETTLACIFRYKLYQSTNTSK